jgi:hypothetical protein
MRIPVIANEAERLRLATGRGSWIGGSGGTRTLSMLVMSDSWFGGGRRRVEEQA